MAENKNFTVLEWIIVNLKFWNKDLHPSIIQRPASKLLPHDTMYIGPLKGRDFEIRLYKRGEILCGDLEVATISRIIVRHRVLSDGKELKVVMKGENLKRALASGDQIISLRYRTDSEESSNEQVVTIINGVSLASYVSGDMWGQISGRLLNIYYQTHDRKLHRINVSCWFQYPEFKFRIGSEKWENHVFVSAKVFIVVEGEVAISVSKEVMFPQYSTDNMVDFGCSLAGSKLNEDKYGRLCLSFIIVPKGHFTHCKSFGLSKFDVVSEKFFCVEIADAVSYSPYLPKKFNIEPSNRQLPATSNRFKRLMSKSPFNILSQSSANLLQWELSVPQSNYHLQSSANQPALQMGLPPSNYHLHTSANPSGLLMGLPSSNYQLQSIANPSGLQMGMPSSNYQIQSSANPSGLLMVMPTSNSHFQPSANPQRLQEGMPSSNYQLQSSANPSGLLMVMPPSNSSLPSGSGNSNC